MPTMNKKSSGTFHKNVQNHYGHDVCNKGFLLKNLFWVKEVHVKIIFYSKPRLKTTANRNNSVIIFILKF